MSVFLVFSILTIFFLSFLLCIGSIARLEISEKESQQIDTAYSVPDQTWVSISKDRRVCAMGKFNMSDDRSRLKEIAHKKKEKVGEKEKEKVVASNLK